jgi:hypothetical protein
MLKKSENFDTAPIIAVYFRNVKKNGNKMCLEWEILSNNLINFPVSREMRRRPRRRGRVSRPLPPVGPQPAAERRPYRFGENSVGTGCILLRVCEFSRLTTQNDGKSMKTAENGLWKEKIRHLILITRNYRRFSEIFVHFSGCVIGHGGLL